MTSAQPSHPEMRFVLLGATGDFASTKLLPALWDLHCAGHLPANLTIIGYALDVPDGNGASDVSSRFHEYIKGTIQEYDRSATDNDILIFIDAHVFDFLQGDARYAGTLIADDLSHNEIKTYYYLALPPDIQYECIRGLNNHGLLDPNGTSSVLIEKPFGIDAKSASSLWELLDHLRKEQVSLIDHYAWKSMVGQIFSLRRKHSWLEEKWNASGINQIQITVSEVGGIGKEIYTYNELGAIGDMVQSHLLLLLAAVAMRPIDVRSDRFDEEFNHLGIDILGQIEHHLGRASAGEDASSEFVRGQYSESEYGSITGYADEKNVRREYNPALAIKGRPEVETFVALRLYVNNGRWQNVPIIVRTGKWMSRKHASISVIFNDRDEQGRRDLLIFRIQPDPRIIISAHSDNSQLKKLIDGGDFEDQGFSVLTQREDARRRVIDRHQGLEPATDGVHAKIINEAINGKISRAVSYDWVKSSWKIIDDIKRNIITNPDRWPLVMYEPGTDGPTEADEVLGEEYEWIL